MSLVSLQNISVGFGGPLLLEGADLTIDRGERVCIVGRNGAGKSTIMRLITGEVQPDSGRIVFQQGIRPALLGQEVPRDLSGSVYDIVSNAFGVQGELLADYHHVSKKLAHDHSGKIMAELEDVQHRLEAAGGWQMHQQIETVLTRLNLPADADFSGLSGGLKRRVLLARALAGGPDLLLLDEPTNHLDINAIAWLEAFLSEWSGTLLFVTHDRALLKKLATRIVDLDRGRLTSWPGSYQTYLERKQASLDAEAAEHGRFDKKLAAEEAWIRQGIKARRTRNEGRVRALKELRRIRSERRERTGIANIQVQEAERSGKLVVEASDAAAGYDGATVFCDLSTTIIRGDRVGIIGPNGSGKTTLLKVLLGELKPQRGTIRHGTNLEISYLDQHREQLDDGKTVQDNVANGSDFVTINGDRRHVIGYLQDFLFTPARARSPVKVLSGGERNRLLLAKLFTRPSNVLVLDEPTNDLDIETLDLLEELVMEYSGTVLIVSHDRAFLNNVVTSTLAIDNQGRVGEYVGGYDDWLRQSTVPAAQPASKPEKTYLQKTLQPAGKGKPRKLTFREQKELEELPVQIEALEAEQQRLIDLMADPVFYRDSGDKVAASKERLDVLGQELEAAYARWEVLELLNN